MCDTQDKSAKKPYQYCLSEFIQILNKYGDLKKTENELRDEILDTIFNTEYRGFQDDNTFHFPKTFGESEFQLYDRIKKKRDNLYECINLMWFSSKDFNQNTLAQIISVLIARYYYEDCKLETFEGLFNHLDSAKIESILDDLNTLNLFDVFKEPLKKPKDYEEIKNKFESSNAQKKLVTYLLLAFHPKLMIKQKAIKKDQDTTGYPSLPKSKSKLVRHGKIYAIWVLTNEKKLTYDRFIQDFPRYNEDIKKEHWSNRDLNLTDEEINSWDSGYNLKQLIKLYLGIAGHKVKVIATEKPKTTEQNGTLSTEQTNFDEIGHIFRLLGNITSYEIDNQIIIIDAKVKKEIDRFCDNPVYYERKSYLDGYLTALSDFINDNDKTNER